MNLSEKSVRPKVLGAKPPPEAGKQSAGKKEGGWGEGIFARLLPFPFRLSKGKAEGGFGGNSAMPERIQKEAAPAVISDCQTRLHDRASKSRNEGGAENRVPPGVWVQVPPLAPSQTW